MKSTAIRAKSRVVVLEDEEDSEDEEDVEEVEAVDDAAEEVEVDFGEPLSKTMPLLVTADPAAGVVSWRLFRVAVAPYVSSFGE